MTSTTWRNWAIIAIAAAGFSGLGNLVLLRYYVNRPPFLLIITPSDHGSIVQFIQPLGFDEKTVVSPKFPVGVEMDEPFIIALISPDCTIPNAAIEFADTTLLPGHFRIRFGDSTIDVMPARIIVDGKNYEWLERPPI
jgi:hypothetical protein